MDETYRRISCELVDFIEIWATQKRKGEIVFISSEGACETAVSVITTWINRHGIEYLILESGAEIRLDRLISVFGVPFTRSEGNSLFC